MATPDIKVGEMYNVRAKVVGIAQNGNPLVCVLNHDIYCFPNELHPITPSEPPTSVGTAPKYDPCRLFKKGDKVRVVEYKGRCGKPYTLIVGAVLTVSQDESKSDTFIVSCNKDGKDFYLDPAYLELITPVEEAKPYSVRHSEVHAAYSIYGPYGLSAVSYFYGDRYLYTKHSAEAAAYAECDRLNAAHRKEQP